ncbi:MAG TPA: hypothetical protein VMV44_07735 [Rectinemataceae bacterium]|nr:hypothetical protein [Rectinemataceae bacterium]
MEREVTLSCDGKAVPLNDFAKTVVINIVAALVGTLKKGDGDGDIQIKIGPRK